MGLARYVETRDATLKEVEDVIKKLKNGGVEMNTRLQKMVSKMDKEKITQYQWSEMSTTSIHRMLLMLV